MHNYQLMYNETENLIYISNPQENLIYQLEYDKYLAAFRVWENNEKDDRYSRIVKFMLQNKIWSNKVKIIRIDYHPLRTIQIEILNVCNFSCKHCYIGQDNNQYLSLNKIIETIDSAEELGVCNISITGGEPLLHPDFWTIIDYINEKHISIDLYTNAYLLTESICRKLKEKKVKAVHLSVDGAEADDHDWLRNRVGSYERNVEAIEWLKQNNILVFATCIVNSKNIKKLDSIKTFFDDLSINYKFDYLIEEGNAKSNFQNICVSEEEYTSRIKDILSDSKEFLNVKKDRFCGAGKEFVYIDAYGNVKICPSIPEDVCSYGNIYTEKLSEIWRRAYFKYETIKCSSINHCKYSKVCCGGCRSRALTMHHNINEPDTIMCRLLEKLDKEVK